MGGIIKELHTREYKIVDESGKVLERFRNKMTAIEMLRYYKKIYFPMKIKLII